jgi:hypothetical protein
MPPLDKSFFGGTGNPDPRTAIKAEIVNTGDSLSEALEALGGEDAALIGCLVLHLTADNTRVNNGEFALRGFIDATELRIVCKKIWPKADAGISLCLTIPEANCFAFSNGGLASDYVDQELVKHHFVEGAENRAPRQITAEAAKERGAGEFSLRVIAQIAKSDPSRGIKIMVTVLLFPLNARAMMDSAEGAVAAGWPGFFLFETDCLLGPKASSEWGCPIMPLLKTGSALKDSPRVPFGEDLRQAVAAIMGRSYKPEYYKTPATVQDKTTHYTEHPEDFSDRPSIVTWPKPQPVTRKGENQKYLNTGIGTEVRRGVLSEPLCRYVTAG